MPLREFDITIGPDGRVELHVSGFKGRRCLDVAQALAEIVGAEESRQLTSEAYEPDSTVHLHLGQKPGGDPYPRR